MSEAPTPTPPPAQNPERTLRRRLTWLFGSVAAVIVLASGYAAVKMVQGRPAAAPDIEMASTAPYPLPAPPAPVAAMPTAPVDALETASASEAESPPAPVRKRRISRAAPAAEEVIGVTPASVTAAGSDEIVVTAGRRPVWVRTPSARRLSAYYPERALDRGREGEASISCIVLDNGALDCVRVSETPARAGFGRAALQVARTLRHAPQRADGSDAVGTPVNLRVVFRLEDNDRRRG